MDSSEPQWKLVLIFRFSSSHFPFQRELLPIFRGSFCHLQDPLVKPKVSDTAVQNLIHGSHRFRTDRDSERGVPRRMVTSRPSALIRLTSFVRACRLENSSSALILVSCLEKLQCKHNIIIRLNCDARLNQHSDSYSIRLRDLFAGLANRVLTES